MADHLSCLHVPGMGDISDTFPIKHLVALLSHAHWFAHIDNFLVSGLISEIWNRQEKDKFFHEREHYFWDEPLIFHIGYDQIIWRCIAKEEQGDILAMCHSS